MTTKITIDHLLKSDLPAAIVSREHLVPVEGEDGVLFPATFAASEDKTFGGGYNIDTFGNENICLVDSVGSQANRIEPMFAVEPFAKLVPQIVIEAGARSVNLLDAGHRAGDAIVRCSALQNDLRGAFKALQLGNAEPLALIAPTSLVFGVWDSRDTQAKAPRLLAAAIRAYNVKKLTRSAQFIPAVEYVDEGLLDEPTDDKVAKLYSKRGFQHVPASASHGGVIATGGIRREVTLHVGALALLRGTTPERTLALRQYLLGLAAVALTKPAVGYLRQGCNLVLHETRKPETRVVFSDGRREEFSLSAAEALSFAQTGAKAFGVGPDRSVKFDRELAKKDLTEGEKAKPKKSKK